MELIKCVSLYCMMCDHFCMMCDHFCILWNIILELFDFLNMYVTYGVMWKCTLWYEIFVSLMVKMYCMMYFYFMWHMEYVALYCIMFDYVCDLWSDAHSMLHWSCLSKHPVFVQTHNACYLSTMKLVSVIICKYEYTTCKL